jgi:hypothetical protein
MHFDFIAWRWNVHLTYRQGNLNPYPLVLQIVTIQLPGDHQHDYCTSITLHSACLSSVVFSNSVPLPTRIILLSNLKQFLRSAWRGINDLIIMKTSVFVPKGCGPINYIFYRCVLTGLTHLDLLTFFSNRGLPFIRTLLFNFLYSSLSLINEPKIHLFPKVYKQINTLDIEYKSSLLRGKWVVCCCKTVMLYKTHEMV